MAGGKDGAGAGAGEARVEFYGGRDGGGHGDVGGWAEGTAEVADVAAHEDECVGGCAREAGDVSYCVLWGL